MRGLVVKGGVLVDATLIAAVKRPYEGGAALPQRNPPAERSSSRGHRFFAVVRANPRATQED